MGVGRSGVEWLPRGGPSVVALPLLLTLDFSIGLALALYNIDSVSSGALCNTWISNNISLLYTGVELRSSYAKHWTGMQVRAALYMYSKRVTHTSFSHSSHIFGPIQYTREYGPQCDKITAWIRFFVERAISWQ